MTTNKDLTKLGVICSVALITLVIVELVLLLFGVGFNTMLFSAISLIIFTGLTMYDIQKMKYLKGDDNYAIVFAMTLYLDVINIFLDILRLIGGGSKD